MEKPYLKVVSNIYISANYSSVIFLSLKHIARENYIV